VLHKLGVTQSLAHFIVATRWDDIPPPVAHQAAEFLRAQSTIGGASSGGLGGYGRGHLDRGRIWSARAGFLGGEVLGRGG
jgi:hypothetical protein